MKDASGRADERGFLGIEGGGTRTTALLASAAGRELQRGEFGPANARLLNDAQLREHFAAIAAQFPSPAALGIGLAGARTEADRARIRAAAQSAWRGAPCAVASDLEIALLADGSPAPARVLILSGTGSCCFGRTRDGKTAKVGGWGHILGDKGSSYEIGLRGLKAVVHYYDRDGAWPRLGEQILAALQLNEPNDLIEWAQRAGKAEIAALAQEVFQAAARRDKIACDILEGAAHTLAKDAAACAARLARKGSPVSFVLSGSALLKQSRFSRRVAGLLKALWPKAEVSPLQRDSVWGAVALAQNAAMAADAERAAKAGLMREPAAKDTNPNAAIPVSTAMSPTERRNPRSMELHRLSLDAGIDLMLSEDEKIPAALRLCRRPIARAIALITQSLKNGGRLFYAGAGTSGRLGVLDASECPPTFRSPPEQVQGIMAGGQSALWRSVEGAEDDAEAGRRAIEFRGVNARDTVVGIAASGRTPFVWGALAAGKLRGAKTVLLCFNPHLRITPAARPNVVIAPDLGPEVLTGSTRLKAGTATKLVLNMFTTLAMTRLGKVASNLMIDLNPSNAKLRDRAARILQELAGCERSAAEAALIAEKWSVKAAWQRLQRAAR